MPKVVKRPGEVLVLHRNYNIQWVPDKHWSKQGLDKANRGQTDTVTGDIYVRMEWEGSNAHEDVLREVLLHEIMHAIGSACMWWNTWDIIDRKKRKDYHEIEECLISTWTPVLLKTMNDNPAVMAYLLGIKGGAN